MKCIIANRQSAGRHSRERMSIKTLFARNECLPLRQGVRFGLPLGVAGARAGLARLQEFRNECLPLRQYSRIIKTKVQFIVPLNRQFAQHNVADNPANPHFPRDPRRIQRYRIGIAVFTA